MRRSLLALAVTLGALALPVPVAVLASIQSPRAILTFFVNDTTDAPDAQLDGSCATQLEVCTLRAAIQEAEFAAGQVDLVRVELDAGIGVYRLTIPPGPEATGPPSNATGDLDISSWVEVIGFSPEASVIDGDGTHRIFDVHVGGTLELKNLTLQNGKAPDPDSATGHLHGGAIHNHGEVHLERVGLINSTAGPEGGGAITNGGNGVLQLINVTIAKNTTEAQGGGIENLGGVLRTGFVTITENSAPAGKGGGIFFSGQSTLIARATLVAKNTAGGDCANAPVPLATGSNLAGDGSCGFTDPTDRSGDPGFDTSAFGPPLFYPLQATSRAVDRVSNLFCGFLPVNVDIRGVSRPQDGNGDGVAQCDTGSYEREATAPLTCNGVAATIYVDAQGVIVGGLDNGRPYRGRLIGTSGVDVMVGTTGHDRIVARKGNDLLCGGEKNDLLEAGPGYDTMTGDAGADRFDGGSGKDTVTDFNPGEGDTKTNVP
jgi:hypothetical protein